MNGNISHHCQQKWQMAFRKWGRKWAAATFTRNTGRATPESSCFFFFFFFLYIFHFLKECRRFSIIDEDIPLLVQGLKDCWNPGKDPAEDPRKDPWEFGNFQLNLVGLDERSLQRPILSGLFQVSLKDPRALGSILKDWRDAILVSGESKPAWMTGLAERRICQGIDWMTEASLEKL